MVITRRLSNGMIVLLEEMNYLRSVSFGVWVKAGSANENEKNNGISHMIEHMLFKGTKSRTAKKLAEDAARIGGNLNAYTSKEYTAYYVTTLDAHLHNAIEMIGDMIQNSLFDETDIEKEKGVIIEEIDMYDDSPEDMVHELLQKKVWENHPLGYIISGEKEIVKGFTRQEIVDFKNRHYVSENMVISVAGHYDETEVMQCLEEQFGLIPNGMQKEELTKPDYCRSFYAEHKDIEQVHMNLAFDCVNCHSDEKYVLAIVNAFLGGSENSKLFQIIREEMGLTYSIYSYDCAYEKAGLFHIDAALNKSKLALVFGEIIKVMEELKDTGISPEELIQMKEQINTELIIGSESTKNRMNSNGRAVLYHEKIRSVDETIQKINLVTKVEVDSFMQLYLRKDRCSMSLIGNMEEEHLKVMKEMWES